MSPRIKARTREREGKIVALRLTGASWTSIANELQLSVRGCELAWSRALDRVVLPDAEMAKRELLEKARNLEVHLWADYMKAEGDLVARAGLARVLIECQRRQAELLGADPPPQARIALALQGGDTRDPDEATVRAMQERFSTEELETFTALLATICNGICIRSAR